MPNVRNDQYVNSGPGTVGPEQAAIEAAVTGSMPTANRVSVTKNPDGTIQTHVSITDATPTTGPVSSQRASTPTDPLGPAAVGVQTGWVEIGDRYKYYKEDGSGFLTGWHSEENADTTLTWYYFDRAPENLEWMVTGWKLVEGADGVERWYYMEKDGRMEIYWLTLTYKDHDKDVVRWYYLQPDGPGQGYMITDWMTINGDWYYFKPDGSDAGYMLTGWYLVKEKWYYSYEDDEKRGIMAANHMIHHTDGKDYYVGADGAMLTSTVFQSEEDGKTYTADGKGVCTEGINEVSDDKAEFSSMSDFKERYGQLIDSFASELGVDDNWLGAVIYVESSGTGFHNGRLLIRFENHKFVARAGHEEYFSYNHNNKSSGHKFRKNKNDNWRKVHTNQNSEYEAFEFAKTISEAAAYESISMGLGQIMGFNYSCMGYSSAKEMFEDFSIGNTEQLIGMKEFIRNNKSMLKALQSKDIYTFAKKYNGPGAASSYEEKVIKAKKLYQNA